MPGGGPGGPPGGEFVMHWEVIQLPAPHKTNDHGAVSQWLPGLQVSERDPTNIHSYEPYPAAESKDLLFYPNIPGDFQLRSRWYMRRRARPMVPAPSHTPMPDKENNPDGKARLYSIYLRPWTLDAGIATAEAPHITNLDIVPSPGRYRNLDGENQRGGSTRDGDTLDGNKSKRIRLRGKQSEQGSAAERSYSQAWTTYVRGNVVSEHAARIIKQFMAACCGK